jgi:hypothetical protein
MKLKYIKRDRALLLTSILLMLMLAAGLFSGIVGFTLGHAALKGVTQPDIRRSNSKTSTEYTKTRGLEVLSEQQLIAEAQDIMGIDRKNEADKFKTDEKPTLVFPIESKDQGIMMTIKSAKLEGTNIKLDIALRNQGSQPVKFNSGVLTIVGEKEESIPFNVTGLPPSLAANGTDVAMKVTILKTAIAANSNVTLRLTDSERKLQIEAKDVPVGQVAAKPPIKISIPDGQLSTTEDDKTKLSKPEKSAQPEKSEKPVSEKPTVKVNPTAKPSPKPSPSAKAAVKRTRTPAASQPIVTPPPSETSSPETPTGDGQ